MSPLQRLMFSILLIVTVLGQIGFKVLFDLLDTPAGIASTLYSGIYQFFCFMGLFVFFMKNMDIKNVPEKIKAIYFIVLGMGIAGLIKMAIQIWHRSF